MKILLVAATAMELESLEAQGITAPAHELSTAVTGVGLVSATYAIMQQITWSRPELIIQAGIAGAFQQGLPTGSAVVVEKEIVADMGVHETGCYQDIFQLGLADHNAFPYQEGSLVNPHHAMWEKTSLAPASSISVNEISTDQQRIALFRDTYKADIESMEGAALHYVCLLQQVSFVQIRGISNFVGERNKQNWKIREALQAVGAACTQLINSL